MSGRCLSVGCMEGVRKVTGSCLEGDWKESGRCLKGIFRVSGSRLKGVWTSVDCLEEYRVSGPEFWDQKYFSTKNCLAQNIYRTNILIVVDFPTC